MSGPETPFGGPRSVAAAAAEAEERGRILLALARDSLVEAFGRGVARRFEAPWLIEPGATFVTLRAGDELRGCVGTIRAYRSLVEDVRANARAAAFNDTRFQPLAAAELPGIAVEVSLLSEPEALPSSTTEEEALARLRPHMDGLILEYDGYRSTFLPQVWEQLPAPRDFMAHLKRKAGLPPAFWSPDLLLWRYTVAKWEETPPKR